VVASLLGWGGIALAGADGWPEVRNPVGVLNVQPDRVVDEQRWSLAEVSGSVAADNKAVAVSSCERCRTAAAAIEVVLVSDLAGQLEAENHAEAVNLDWSTCSTAARMSSNTTTRPSRRSTGPRSSSATASFPRAMTRASIVSPMSSISPRSRSA
jgi:hypothetical protein